MKNTGIIVIALAMLIALTGVVMADQVVPAVPELQGITTSTVTVVEGTVMDSAALGWSLSNQSLAARGGLTIINKEGPDPYVADWPYMLDPYQTQYSTTYDSSTVAQHGQTTFIKTMGISTGNKLLTQSNVKANTEATFVATGDGGNIVGSENIMIDGASMPTPAADRMLCPFGAAGGFPAYCNIVQAGSKYDLVVGSVVTSANDRFVGTDATVPVELNYAINVKPYGTTEGSIPAMGSASAYVKAHIQEARNDSYIFIPTDPRLPLFLMDIEGKNEDLTYSESTSVSGVISSFGKTIAYQSGKALL